MPSKWKIGSGMLAAVMMLSCDRAKLEQPGVDWPEATTQEIQTNLPPIAVYTPEPRAAAPSAPPDHSAPQMAPALQLDPRPATWELQLAETASRLKARERARAIFAMLPALPPEALARAAEQAVEHLPDTDYPAIALPVIVDPQTHGQVLSVLFADLLERPDAITLPALLSIAKTPNHPFAPSALDDLHLLLRANHGRDWSQWDAAIRARLATIR